MRDDRMNIIKQLERAINENDNFFSSELLPHVKKSLKYNSLKYLNSKTYRELEDNSRGPREITYNIHEKSRTLIPLTELMRLFELYEEYAYKEQRLHFPHLVNTYLLGLYIYHNNSVIKEACNKNMDETPNNIRLANNEMIINFSGGTPEGEFFYRWRLTSLSHDIGYPIELLSHNQQRLNNLFIEINSRISTNIKSLKDLYYYKNRIDLLLNIDKMCKSVQLSKYITIQEENPKYINCKFDHGIFGALLFLNSMHAHFSLYREGITKRADNSRILTTQMLLEGPICSMASAIALHNLEAHEIALGKSVVNDMKIYNLEEDPISYLLKLVDEIQEWHKFSISEFKNGIIHYDMELPKVNMTINFNDGDIIIKNFPEQKVSIIENKYKKYFNPNYLLRFE